MACSQPFLLAASADTAGFRLHVFEKIGSTNDAALAFARDGGCERSWFVARAQTRGRGRHGRVWISPKGNLYASLLLLDAAPLAIAPQLGFVAGIALARTLRALLSDDPRLKLKWPNDIVFDGAKLAGILIEGARLGNGGFASVTGFGVNCSSYPRGLAYPATALSETAAAAATAQQVFLRLSGEIVHWLDVFAAGKGFSEIRREWLALACGLGEPIRIATVARKLEGRFETIDATGRLLLRNETGTIPIDAGDVIAGH